MEAQLRHTSRTELLLRKHRALIELQSRFTPGRILARSKAGTLCDCERDTATELETVDWLLNGGPDDQR